MTITYEEYCEQVIAEVKAETQRDHHILSKVGYVRFMSRSKGRNRRRKRSQIVELIKYLSSCHTPKRAKLDEIAADLGGVLSDDELLEYLREH